ncbi:hypothetical protein LSO9J_180012 [Candidatus Liberibacter solanacearum]
MLEEQLIKHNLFRCRKLLRHKWSIFFIQCRFSTIIGIILIFDP